MFDFSALAVWLLVVFLQVLMACGFVALAFRILITNSSLNITSNTHVCTRSQFCERPKICVVVVGGIGAAPVGLSEKGTAIIPAFVQLPMRNSLFQKGPRTDERANDVDSATADQSLAQLRLTPLNSTYLEAKLAPEIYWVLFNK